MPPPRSNSEFHSPAASPYLHDFGKVTLFPCLKIGIIITMPIHSVGTNIKWVTTLKGPSVVRHQVACRKCELLLFCSSSFKKEIDSKGSRMGKKKTQTFGQLCPVNTSLLRSLHKPGEFQGEWFLIENISSNLHSLTEEGSEAQGGKVTS